MSAMSDDRPASVADIVVEELRKKEINGPIRLPKRDFFTRGQKLKVKDPWHILSGYDLEFAGMSTRERVRVMLEWFGRRQTIALPINSVVGCLKLDRLYQRVVDDLDALVGGTPRARRRQYRASAGVGSLGHPFGRCLTFAPRWFSGGSW